MTAVAAGRTGVAAAARARKGRLDYGFTPADDPIPSIRLFSARKALLGALLLAVMTLPAAGAEILNTGSYWRYFIAWKTELVRGDAGALRVLPAFDARPGDEPGPIASSALPPADWAAPDFDDSAWARTRGPVPAASAEMALLCLRGKFAVRDPAAAGDLKLSLEVKGGAIVYLNGREVARQGMPDGKPALDDPATDYPEEAYLDPEGFLYRNGWGDDVNFKERLRARIRSLHDVTVPAAALRKGTNVLAVEIHRAAASELLLTRKTRDWSREAWRKRGHFWWSRLDFGLLSLTAAAGRDGAVANVARPAGLQLWNHPVCQRVLVSDYGDPNESLRPLSLCGPRNSVLAAQVVMGADKPLVDLKVAVSQLQAVQGAGRIAAEAVDIRYPQADGPRSGAAASFETLAPGAPATVAVDKSGGAVQPVWFNLRVPQDAQPGTYTGAVTISAEGAAAVEVPLQVKVCDWTMPKSQDFTAHVGLVQSPESVALQYDVALWSERHWQLMEKSFELMGQLGADCVFLPLIRHTHFGNEHGMVRWIRQADGGYRHDFALIEKYLDLAIKHLGKPEVVCLYCWEMVTGHAYLGNAGKEGKGMAFTILDPASGRLEAADGPKWGTPEIRPFWQPVIDGCREILKKRGLEKSMMVGTAGDWRPNRNAVEDLKAVAPDAPWVVQSHSFADNLSGVPVGYACDVWNSPVIPDPAARRLYGWQYPFVRATFPRAGSSTVGAIIVASPPAQYFVSLEGMQAAGIRGFGRVGADFWNVLGKERNKPVSGCFPESGWAQLNLENAATFVMTPGPDGALPTVRFEMIRAAAQQVEARSRIEKALLDPAARDRLGEARAARLQQLLDERTRAIIYATRNGWLWFLSSGWQARDDALFAAAAEVQPAPTGR